MAEKDGKRGEHIGCHFTAHKSTLAQRLRGRREKLAVRCSRLSTADLAGKGAAWSLSRPCVSSRSVALPYGLSGEVLRGRARTAEEPATPLCPLFRPSWHRLRGFAAGMGSRAGQRSTRPSAAGAYRDRSQAFRTARRPCGMGILPMTPPRPRWLFWTAVATLPLWEPEARFRLDGLGTPGPLWHGHPAHEMAVPPAPGAET